jgi:hypothetical protein
MDRGALLAAIYGAACVSERERIYRSGYYLNPDEETRQGIADRAREHAEKVMAEQAAAMERADLREHEAIDAAH